MYLYISLWYSKVFVRYMHIVNIKYINIPKKMNYFLYIFAQDSIAIEILQRGIYYDPRSNSIFCNPIYCHIYFCNDIDIATIVQYYVYAKKQRNFINVHIFFCSQLFREKQKDFANKILRISNINNVHIWRMHLHYYITHPIHGANKFFNRKYVKKERS